MSYEKLFHRSQPEPSNVVEALTPPWSEKCEHCLISSVLQDETGGAVSVAQQAGVKVKAFYSAPNQKLWAAIEDLCARRVALTVEALTVSLQSRQDLAEVGLEALLAATGEIVSSAKTAHFAEELVLLWQRRHALTLAAELREQAMDFDDREKFVGFCSALGRKLVSLGQKADTRTLAERIDTMMIDVEARATGKEDRSRWIFTGLPTFDQRLRPLNSAREDQVIVVAGGSGMGKSALMRQWALQACAQNKRVALFNRETSTDGCIEQMAAMAAGLDLKNPDRALHETLKRFREVGERMRDEWAEKYLFCYEHDRNVPLLMVEDLVARVHHHAYTHGTPDLLIVDYLQLFGTKKRGQSREQEVAEVSHQLQALGREINSALVIGCQMNEKGLAEMRVVHRERTSDGKEGKVIHRIPNAGDLRESQAIYHDADRVIALYRPPVDSRDQDQTGPNIDKPEQWLCQIKRRKGGEGIVKCRFEKPYTRFVELGAEAGGEAKGPKSKEQWRGERGGHQ